MGRFISESVVNNNLNDAFGAVVRPPGFLGIFGNGLYKAFQDPGTFSFIVPSNVSSIRVRVVGGGGSGCGGGNGVGGGGGGYAHGVFSVTPGSTYTVTVGAGGKGNYGGPGGTSSFGSLISATGGAYSTTITSAEGGVGIGGDFQAKGGSSGACPGSGGGGAGSQLGDGGHSGGGSGVYNTGGGGVGGGNGIPYSNSGGGSAFGRPSIYSGRKVGAPNCLGLVKDATYDQNHTRENEIGAVIRFPFDGFTGGGGTFSDQAYASAGGSGGGGAGGGLYAVGLNLLGGLGGSGGGGGGGAGGNAAYSAGGVGGGGGGVYTEPVNTPEAGNGGNGLVVVEW